MNYGAGECNDSKIPRESDHIGTICQRCDVVRAADTARWTKQRSSLGISRGEGAGNARESG